MIELQRHIEILLLDNDCVIVPDFGGFVAHQASARYDEDDHAFLPPMRTLGFNPQLRINDSLLVQSYINAYDISYPEALHRIEDEVAELKQVLASEGCYDMNGIGLLTVNDEGNCTFEPCEAGILSPEYYGMGATEFWTLKERPAMMPAAAQDATAETVALEPEEPASPTLLEFTDSDDDEGTALRIKMSWVRNAVAVAAAIVAFFLIATPIANSDLGTRTMSQLQGNLLYRLLPQDTNMVPAEPVVPTAEAAPVKAEAPAAKTAETIAEPTTKPAEPAAKPTPSYCIVLASQVKKSNAESYVEQLHKRGYEQAAVYIHNNIVRVVYGAYQTEAEAYQQLNKLNDQEEFAEAWVYQKKAEA